MTDHLSNKSLEERIAKLETTPRKFDRDMSIEVALLGKKVDQLFELLRAQKEWLDAETALSREARRQTTLLAKAYYDIFPERYLRDNADGDPVSGGPGDGPDAR